VTIQSAGKWEGLLVTLQVVADGGCVFVQARADLEGGSKPLQLGNSIRAQGEGGGEERKEEEEKRR
jgi:hypothetical protein